MHTVEMLEQSVALAERIGYEIRQVWLGGSGGGACEIKGRKVIFLDLALGPADQLETVIEALRREPEALAQPIPFPLRAALAPRKSA